MKRFSTSDIQIAAALLAIGLSMHEPTRSAERFGQRPKAVFHFDDTSELREALTAYANDRLLVSARVLLTRLRELKSTAFSVISNA